MTGFAQRSDAFDANASGRGGRGADGTWHVDPRPPIKQLRIRALQELCAKAGAPEALGIGDALPNGDSTAWRREKCEAFLAAYEMGVRPEGHSRPIGDQHKPLKIEEYAREDILGSLLRLGVTPGMGEDTEVLRAKLKAKLSEFDVGKPEVADRASDFASPALPASVPTPLVEQPLPAAGQLTDMRMQDVRKLAKRLNVNSFGKSREALIPLLTEALNTRKN